MTGRSGVIMSKHKTLKEVKKNLGDSELIEKTKCPKCGGILVTSYGIDISCTLCVDCTFNEYDYN